MKIIKGMFGFLIFMCLTFGLAILIILQFEPSIGAQKTITIFTLFFSIGMGRLGYALFTGHITSWGIPKLIQNIDWKGVLFKKKK